MQNSSWIIIAILAGLAPVSGEQYLYLASKTNKLVSYTINTESGALKPHSAFELPGAGGPMAMSADHKFLYIESHFKIGDAKRPSPHIVTLKHEAGQFTQTLVAPVHLRSPGIFVDATGKNLLGAHYGEGKVSVWKIDDSRACTGKLTDEHTTAANAHFVTTDPSGRFVYVPHTAPNAVYQFSLDPDKGLLTPLDPPFVSGPEEGHDYHQPRHYAHHPTLKMGYTSNERGGGISSWKFDSKTGALTLHQTLSSLPPDWKGGSAAADIHITPNGKFVYISNRDTRKLEEGAKPGDTIAGFSINQDTGALTPIGHFPTEYFPRAFRIDTTGRFLYVAGQKSNKLAAYRINQDTGALERVGTYETGEAPIWVICWSQS